MNRLRPDQPHSGWSSEVQCSLRWKISQGFSTAASSVSVVPFSHSFSPLLNGGRCAILRIAATWRAIYHIGDKNSCLIREIVPASPDPGANPGGFLRKLSLSLSLSLSLLLITRGEPGFKSLAIAKGERERVYAKNSSNKRGPRGTGDRRGEICVYMYIYG